MKTLADELGRIKNLSETFNGYLEDKKLYEKSQSAYLKSQEKAAQDLNAHSLALKAYLDEQAGVLAENLKDGDTCPVCGSKNHPHLATKKGAVLTRDAIDNLDHIAKASQKQAESDSESASSLKATMALSRRFWERFPCSITTAWLVVFVRSFAICMMPEHIKQVRRLIYNANGKIDRHYYKDHFLEVLEKGE